MSDTSENLPNEGVVVNTEVQSSDTLFRNSFEISIEAAKIVNYAAAQNNIPLIQRLIIRNKSEQSFRQVDFQISVNPAFFEPKRFTFDIFGAEESRTFNSVQLRKVRTSP